MPLSAYQPHFPAQHAGNVVKNLFKKFCGQQGPRQGGHILAHFLQKQLKKTYSQGGYR